MRKKGFTLIELIVVIAIIGVLAAILVPAMVGYVTKSRIMSSNAAARDINTAVSIAALEMVQNDFLYTKLYDKYTFDSTSIEAESEVKITDLDKESTADMEKYIDEAVSCLDELPPSAEKPYLVELARYVGERTF